MLSRPQGRVCLVGSLWEPAAIDMNLCRKDVMRPARIMKAVYQRNLERMMELPDASLADPTVSKRLVGSKEKLLIAVRHGFF